MTVENELKSNDTANVHLENDPVSHMEQRVNDWNGDNLLHADQITSSSTNETPTVAYDGGSEANENDMNAANMLNDQASSSQAIDAQNVCFL